MSINNEQVRFIWVEEGGLPSSSVPNALYFLKGTRKIHVNGISFGTNDNDFITYLANDSNKAINGNLTIGGDLTVGGTTTIINATELQVSDQIITVAKDNSSNLVGYAGLEIPKYNGTDTLGLVMRSDGILRIGKLADKSKGPSESGNNLQAVLTRDDSPNDGGVLFWDSEAKKAVSLSPSAGKFLQSGLNGNKNVPKWVSIQLDDIHGIESHGKNLLKATTASAARFAIGAIGSVSLATGDSDGTVRITVDGISKYASVKGLGGAAYKAENHYATAGHVHGNINNAGLITATNEFVPSHVAVFSQNPVADGELLKSISIKSFREQLGSGDSGFLTYNGIWTNHLGSVRVTEIFTNNGSQDVNVLKPFQNYLTLGDSVYRSFAPQPTGLGGGPAEEIYGEIATVEYVQKQISWEVY